MAATYQVSSPSHSTSHTKNIGNIINLYSTVVETSYRFLFQISVHFVFFLPTNSNPHTTLCHSLLYFVLCEVFVFMLHIYSEILFWLSIISAHTLKSICTARNRIKTTITIYLIHPRKMGRHGKIMVILFFFFFLLIYGEAFF